MTISTEHSSVSSAELAERLYTVWAARQDFLNPLPSEKVSVNGWQYASKTTRPAWRLLTAQEQSVWLNVAEAAGRAVADAMELASA